MVTIPATDWRTWRGRVIVRCPGCRTELPLDHDVAADGTITPSLDCPVPACDFHDWGRLEGWPADEV